MNSFAIKNKKRKFDETNRDEYEDEFPDIFNIEYSTMILKKAQSSELGEARKVIVNSFYKTLDNGHQWLKIDLCKYTFESRKQIISEILARFPRINYNINVFGNKSSYTIYNNYNQMDLNECAKALEFIVPLNMEENDSIIIASYIS
jgi:hypothetical protein